MPRIPLNDKRTQELNSKIFERNIPSHTIDPLFSPKPMNTRYTKMNVYDNNEHNVQTPITTNKQYQTSQVFFPGNRKPHWTGFVTNVDTESTLRNQFFALQKCDQSVYVPSSTSDLYVNKTLDNKINNSQNESLVKEDNLMFREFSFNTFNPNIFNSGTLLFNNSTRVQRNENGL